MLQLSTCPTIRGNTFEIPNIGNGVYSANILAVPTRSYTLSVELNSKIFEAISYLPERVELSEVYGEFEEATPFNDEGYTVYFGYNDPIGVRNYYRGIHYLNGKIQQGGDNLQVMSDNLSDGSATRFPLFRKIFEPGDSVSIELVHFDEASFNYFTSLGDIIGGGRGPAAGASAPGNPISNWSGENVLGYFSAYSSDTLGVKL